MDRRRLGQTLVRAGRCRMPKATVELHADGRFDVCMRLPDGTENWSRCHFTEVMEPEKISVAGSMEGPSGKWFNIVTTIILMEETGGTRLEVVQDYKVFSAKALRTLTGVEAGWNSTLTQLGQEAERLAAPSLRGTFTLERTLQAPQATPDEQGSEGSLVQRRRRLRGPGAI